MRADWLKIVSVTRWKYRTSMSCRGNDGVSKENLHFDNQSYLFVAVFSKMGNMFAVFLSSYRNTSGNLGELKKAVAILACSS